MLKAVLTQVVKCEEGPCPPTSLDWFDIIVDPSIRDGTTFVGHFQSLQKSFETRHDDARLMRQQAQLISRKWI